MCKFCEEYQFNLDWDKEHKDPEFERRYGIALVSQSRPKGTQWRGQYTRRPNFSLNFCPECGRPLKRNKVKMTLDQFNGVLNSFVDNAFKKCDDPGAEYVKRYSILRDAAIRLAAKHGECYVIEDTNGQV